MAEPIKNVYVTEIMNLLPHRYPFVLVDRVVEVIPGESIKAYKNLTINEPFFQGHFPGTPVMPGVLIIEAMAQAGGLIVLFGDEFTEEDRRNKLFLFTGIEHVRFRRPVYPGDRLDLECVLVRRKLQLWKIETKAYVDGRLAAQATLTAAITDKKDL